MALKAARLARCYQQDQGTAHAQCLQPYLEHLVHGALLAHALLLLQRPQLPPQRPPLRILLRAVTAITLLNAMLNVISVNSCRLPAFFKPDCSNSVYNQELIVTLGQSKSLFTVDLHDLGKQTGRQEDSRCTFRESFRRAALVALMSLRQSLASALLSEAATCASRLAPSTLHIRSILLAPYVLLMDYLHSCSRGSTFLLNIQTSSVRVHTHLQGLLGTQQTIQRQHCISPMQRSLRKGSVAFSGTMDARNSIFFVPEAAAEQGAQLAPPSAWGRLL